MNKTDHALYEVSFLPILSSYVASVVAEAKAWHSRLIQCKNTNTAVDNDVLGNAVAITRESSRLANLYHSHVGKWQPEATESEYKDALMELTTNMSELMSINQNILAVIQVDQDGQ